MTDLLSPPSRLTPEAPPPPAWHAAEAALAARAADAEAAARSAFADWLAEADRAALAPLHDAAARAADAHRAHARHLADALAEAAEAESPGNAWRAVDAYRLAVSDDVVAPLHDILAAGAGARVGETYGALLERLAAANDDVEETVTLPAPDDLFAPDARDGALLRTRKAAVRGGRVWRRGRAGLANAARRVVRRPARALPPAGRDVPAHRLFAHHLRVRLPRLFAPAHDALQAALAGRVVALERAVSVWTHAVLRAESDADAPAFHVPPPPPAAPAPPPTAGFGGVRERADALQAALDAAAEPLPPPALDGEALAAATAALVDDLARGGTFFLRPSERPTPGPREGPAARAAAERARWSAWHTRAAGTVGLSRHLLDARALLLGFEEHLLAHVAAVGLHPILDAFARLGETLAERLAESAPVLDAGADRAALRALQARALAPFAPVLQDLPGLVPAEAALREAGHSEAADAEAAAARFPERLPVHVLDDPGDPPGRLPGRSVPIRAFYEDALQPPLPERLAGPAAALRRALLHAWSELESVEHIVRYNLGAALDEDDPDGVRELTTDGLTRAADRLAELGAGLDGPWSAFAETVHTAYADDWRDLHRRVRSDAPIEQTWAGLQMRLRRGAGRAERRTRTLYQAGRRRTAQLFRLGRRHTAALVRRGQAAVGVLEGAESDRRAVLDALAGADALRAGLPLVYRKLFTFSPLEEPALLEGRAADVGRARAHAERWRDGHPAGPLVLTLPLGAGRTTLLNAIAHTLEADFDVRRLVLTGRPDETELAVRVAAALGVQVDDGAPLDAVEAALAERGPTARPRVLLMDNLEHLVLRAPGGGGLAERALLFFARLGGDALVIGAAGRPLWRYVEQTAPGAAALAAVHPAAPIGRTALEALVVGRHRRSGMPLRFAAPADPAPLLRQRLRRARTEEARHSVLRADYFDRLHRTTGQNVMLALFYWLRSADFGAEPGAVVIQPLTPLPTGFLDGLELPQAFTLKAFVQHHTLTLTEHNRIFRMTAAQSAPLLAGLLALRLIEPVSPAHRSAPGAATRLDRTARYRLNPLLLHPITESLMARHILY